MNSVENKRLARVKYLARNVIEKSDGTPSPFVGMEDVLGRYGRLVSSYEELEDKSATDSLRTQPGDVLFGKLRPYLAKSLLLEESASCTGEFLVMRAQRGCLPRYLYYLTLSEPWLSWAEATSYGSKMPRTSWELMSRLEVPELTEKEQSAIADFLDRETAKIDALIAKQEQLIATLREDRIATITHAVTKGLDPNAEMKDTGVEWLGEIPAHWEASRLKFVVKSVDSGTSVNAGDWTPSADEIGVLKTSCVSTGRFNAAGSKTVVDPEEIGRVTCPVRGGSLIVNRANTPQLVGSTGYAEVDYPNLYLSDKLWQVRFRSASAKFIHLWSQTEAYRSQIAAKCVGASSSMQNLSMGDFRDIAFGLPPMPEQQLIVEHLDTHCAKLDALIAKSEQMIGVLREYRSALITDAVTGKIDVRGAA